MKTGICDARKRIFSQIALFSLFLLCTSVGNAWSDDSMPTAKTRQVSNVTSSSATLKGTVYSTNPSRNVYYSFQWGTTTSYENQTRNQSASTSADRPEVEVTEELTNLSPNTTYYYRLAVSDGQGQAYGEDKIFTTYVPPTVTTDTATNVTFSTATLIGTVNPNGIKTSVCFYYGPGSGEVNTRKQDIGSGTSPLSASATISNLRPGTTYYYRMEASSSGGTVSGPQMSFTTPALLPSVSTDDAAHVANHTATLNGTINPHETNVSYYFQWGPNENPSAYKTHIRSAGSGSEPVKVSATVGGLKPGTSYYYTILADYNYRIGGVESRGQANGENRSFTTLISPGAATMQATNITSNSVTLNATVTPNGLPTVWYFEIRKFLFFTTWKRIGTREEPVTQNWNASLNISGLEPNSTYRYRIAAKSDGGITYGAEMMFKTPPFALPLVTTGPAYNITKNSATLEGILNPKGSPVSYWFQYGTDNTYGKFSTGQSGVGGTNNATVSVTINGLIPKTTYHYRLMASSVKGSVHGLDKTFTTPFSPQDVATGVVPGGTKTLIAPSAKPMMTAGTAAKIVSAPKSTVTVGTATKLASVSNSKPTVTTGTATKVASTLATINGTVNPNGSATTYYFEYGPTPSYGNTVPISPQSAGGGAINVNVSADISGKFTPTNTYHYRIVATNKSGTSHGEDKSFTIPSTLLPAIKNISPAPASKSVTGARP